MDNVIRGANWWFDTINTWIGLDEVELPKIERMKEKFSGAGNPLALGLPEEFDELEATIKMKENNPRIRALVGREPGRWINCYYYERLTSLRDGSNRGRVITMRGLVNSVQDERKKGLKPTTVDYKFGTIVAYHDMFDGRSIHKFDFFAPWETVIDGERVYAEAANILALQGGQ